MVINVPRFKLSKVNLDDSIAKTVWLHKCSDDSKLYDYSGNPVSPTGARYESLSLKKMLDDGYIIFFRNITDNKLFLLNNINNDQAVFYSFATGAMNNKFGFRKIIIDSDGLVEPETVRYVTDESGVSDLEIMPIQQTGVKVATVNDDGAEFTLYAPDSNLYADWDINLPALTSEQIDHLVELGKEGIDENESKYSIKNDSLFIGNYNALQLTTLSNGQTIFSNSGDSDIIEMLDIQQDQLIGKPKFYIVGDQVNKPIQPAGNYVTTNVTINGYPLTSDINLNAADVSAATEWYVDNAISTLSNSLTDSISSISTDLSNAISSLNEEIFNTISSISTDLSNAISALDNSLSNYLPLSGFKTITGLVSSNYDGYLYANLEYYQEDRYGDCDIDCLISANNDPFYKVKKDGFTDITINNKFDCGMNVYDEEDNEYWINLTVPIIDDEIVFKLNNEKTYIYSDEIYLDNIDITYFATSNGDEEYDDIWIDENNLSSQIELKIDENDENNIILRLIFNGILKIKFIKNDEEHEISIYNDTFTDRFNFSFDLKNGDITHYKPFTYIKSKTGYFATESDLDRLENRFDKNLSSNVLTLSNEIIDLSSQAFIQRAKMALENSAYAFPFDIYELSDGTILTSNAMGGIGGYGSIGQVLDKNIIDRGTVRISIGTRSDNIPETVSLDVPIDDRCVYANNTVKSVTIPASLKFVYACLFGKFTALENVIIDDDCKAVFGSNNHEGNCGTFYNCSSLINLNLKNCRINYYNSFEGCTKLRKISSFESIGGVFTNCSNLTEIDCPNTVYLKLDGCTSFKNYSKFDNITHSGTYIFGDSGLTSFNVNYANIHPTRPEYNSGARFDFSNSNIEKLFVNVPYIGHSRSIANVFAEAEKLKEIDCRNLSSTIKYSSTSGSRLRINLNQDQYLIVPDSLYDDFINDPQYEYSPLSNLVKASDWEIIRKRDLVPVINSINNHIIDKGNPHKVSIGQVLSPEQIRALNWSINHRQSILQDEAQSKLSGTTSPGITRYADLSAEILMEIIVTTKFDGSLVNADTPTGWTHASTGTYKRTLSSASGSIPSATFNYVVSDSYPDYAGLSVSYDSVARSIATVYPAYHGYVNANVTSLTGIIQELSSTRLSVGFNKTLTLTNNTGISAYYWILTHGSATATQFTSNILNSPTENNTFISPKNPNITLNGYKLYRTTNTIARNGKLDDVALKINL